MSIVLRYFDEPWRAEPIRLALNIGGLAFEDVRYDFWTLSHREDSPTGQLPVLEVDGHKFVESLAILNYVGGLANLLPAKAEDILRSSQVLYFLQGLWDAVDPIYKATEDNERRKAQAICAEEFARMFRIVEHMLADSYSNGLSLGGKLSVCDLAVHVWYEYALNNGIGFEVTKIEQFTRLSAIHNTVKSHPRFIPFRKKLVSKAE